jgi:hypothetical protein
MICAGVCASLAPAPGPRSNVPSIAGRLIFSLVRRLVSQMLKPAYPQLADIFDRIRRISGEEGGAVSARRLVGDADALANGSSVGCELEGRPARRCASAHEEAADADLGAAWLTDRRGVDRGADRKRGEAGDPDELHLLFCASSSASPCQMRTGWIDAVVASDDVEDRAALRAAIRRWHTSAKRVSQCEISVGIFVVICVRLWPGRNGLIPFRTSQ